MRSMKKFIVPLLAMCMVVCFATASMAANLADVKTTSEAITGASGACEKIGSISFTFKEGTILRDGDWWYADLPIGVTICHSIDFAILGTAGGVAPGGGAFVSVVQADGTSTTNGFYTVTDLGTNGLADGITVAGGIWIRISAASGSHRLMFQVFDSDDLVTYNAAVNVDGSSSLTVNTDSQLTIKVMDGNYHVAGPWGYNDTDTTAATKGVYGEDAADVLGFVNTWDNSLCAGAYGHTLPTVNVSLNSGGFSGPNFITFNPTNPEVAHMIYAAAISLQLCMADEFGFVALIGGQGATCIFDYETPTNYCTDRGSANFKASTVTGNKILIQNSTGTFYDALDNYQIVLQISGNGAYWGNATPAVAEYYPANTAQCAAHASAGNEANMPGGAWTIATETAVAAGAPATGAGCAAIAAGSQWIKLTSPPFTGIDDCNQIEVNMPTIVYDPARFVAGGQVTVTVSLNRLPCGQVFTGTRVVAEFVDTCPLAAAITTLLFPYATSLDNPSWWFGMSFCNPTLANAAAGTALITVYEDDGDIGTYTTPDITVGGMVTYGGAELLSNLTPDAANTGTLGDSRCHIIVNCNFGAAGGFGMMGNGSDSTGYAAYGNSATWAY